MKETSHTYLKGQFLIAMPELSDPNFSKTVTCICEHTDEGALGIIINKVHPFLQVESLLKELNLEYSPNTYLKPLHIGGPVRLDGVFILHGPPFDWRGCFNITNSLALSNTKDILESMVTSNTPKSSIITLGSAGWGPGQLESELMANAWITSPISEEIIFEVSVEKRWEEALKMIGVNPASLSSNAGHA